MLQTITPSEMKRVEQRAITGLPSLPTLPSLPPIPSLTLMEHAAQAVADAALPYLSAPSSTLLALCGPGNNGADGLAAVRILLAARPALRAALCLVPGRETREFQTQRERLAPFAERLTILPTPTLPPATACVLDAVFGTGLSRAPEGHAAALIRLANASSAPVIAVDIPSGLDGESGRAFPDCVRATLTVTFHRPKPGLFLADGLDHSGHVRVADIGVPAACDDAPGLWMLAPGDPLLPPRARLSHKGTYGRALAVVGSFGMAGAAALCATAALRTGVGLMTVACPREIVPTVQALCPCATCLPLDPDPAAAWAALADALPRFDALAVGCGLGQSPWARALLARLLPHLAAHPVPAVLDADALNLLAQSPRAFPASVHLTPHPAEAARLLAAPLASVLSAPLAAARDLRARYGATIVLKSAATIVSAPDGDALNPYGTPAMAKGGSGDALTGVLLALLAAPATYRLSGFRLPLAACALHGLAGRAAARRLGERAVLATDLCEELGNIGDGVGDE